MVSHPELGLNPPIGSDWESGCDILSNLVTHVAQLTRQQGTANAIQTSPWELCKLCGG